MVSTSDRATGGVRRLVTGRCSHGKVRRLVAGALAGAVGTAAMDLVLYRRYRRQRGKESAWRSEFAG